MEDNQGAIAIAKNPIAHARTKHIDICYHFIRETIQDKTIELRYCPTDKMLADLLTKPLYSSNICRIIIVLIIKFKIISEVYSL